MIVTMMGPYRNLGEVRLAQVGVWVASLLQDVIL